MTKPSVSVVIPSHRRPVLAQRAVASVLAQTFSDFEVIVVLDGADPASEASLAAVQVQDQRVKLISVADPVGGSEARNIGVAAFGVGAHAERHGDQVDEIAKSEDAAKFVQRGGVLEEFTL